MRRAIVPGFLGLLLACGACGKSGEDPTRPVELLMNVTGAAAAVGIDSIESALVTHTLPRLRTCVAGARAGQACASGSDCAGARCLAVYPAPHLFVLQNAEQPVVATLYNLDAAESLRVDMFAGTFLHSAEIPPGSCCRIGTDEACEPATDCGPTPAESGPEEVRFEVTAPGSPTGVGFFATVGDFETTYMTACVIAPSLNNCTTPATFFYEGARDHISGVFSKLENQDEDAHLRAELYVDGSLADSGEGGTNAVAADDL